MVYGETTHRNSAFAHNVAGLHSHARKSEWIRRKRDGKTIEYHIDSLPEEVKEVLHLHQVNETRAFYRLKSNDESIGAQLWDDVCEKIPLLQRESSLSWHY